MRRTLALLLGGALGLAPLGRAPSSGVVLVRNVDFGADEQSVRAAMSVVRLACSW